MSGRSDLMGLNSGSYGTARSLLDKTGAAERAPVSDGHSVGFRGGERHLLAPLGAFWEVPGRKARRGGKRAVESPHEGVIVSVGRQRRQSESVCSYVHMTSGGIRSFTSIADLCCCRLQTAALQPGPPELNASHI